MDPRYAWMVTFSGDPSRLHLEGVEVTREGVSWIRQLITSIEGYANGHGRSLSLEVGEWALYADRFDELEDSIQVTHAAQAILDETGLSDARPLLVIKRITEPTGFGYSIWSAFDSLYVGADSPLNPDKDPGGR